jgi:hypothetical protein
MNTIYDFDQFDRRGRNWLVKRAKKELPVSRSHVAAEVLGCSKYYMSRWIQILEELGIDCFYSDTDSAIMDYHGYAKARKVFKKRYGFDIDGDAAEHKRPNPPGTLHPDFKPEDVMYATELIAVGKKAYYMVCLRENGETCEVYKFKGMSGPSKTIPRYCQQNGITVREFFLSLLEGEAHNVPQVYQYSNPSFTHNPKTWEYTSNSEFNRVFHFDGDYDLTILEEPKEVEMPKEVELPKEVKPVIPASTIGAKPVAKPKPKSRPTPAPRVKISSLPVVEEKEPKTGSFFNSTSESSMNKCAPRNKVIIQGGKMVVVQC